MHPPATTHRHDHGLPPAVIRHRRRQRRIARIMLIICGLTALAGWSLLGRSIASAITLKDQSPYQAIIAYAILIVSSVTLVLGLWYLLLAQVERISQIVEADDATDPAHPPLCPNCGWFFDPPDRYCRHCGKPLNTTIMPQKPDPSP